MDWAKYKQLDRDEWEARKRNPVTIEVTAEDFRAWSTGLMLLRRVQGNTKDADLLGVDQALSPLLGRVRKAFEKVPEIQAINEQRWKMLGK